MNKQPLANIILLTMCFILFFIVLEDKKHNNQIPVTGASIEQVEAMGGWWISVPAAENRFLAEDITATSFVDYPDDYYLIMPKETDETRVVFYIRDIADQYAIREVCDFSNGDVKIGSKNIIFVRSNLPFVYLSVDSSQFNTMISDIDKQYSVKGKVNVDSKIKCGITLYPRGNTSWWPQRKKPYTLKLDKSKPLLNMKSHKRWNMICNFGDLTILTNSVFYDLAEDIGLPYTCERENATVYINGSYEGVYLITTKVKVDRDLINLSKEDFLLCFADSAIDSTPDKVNYFEIESEYIEGDLERYRCFNIEYPESDADKDFIQSFTQEAFDALAEKNSDDYLKYFDIDNLARFYLFEEYCLNGDACYGSIYLYYDHNIDKLVFGPVWDLDNTLNMLNPNYEDLVANRSWYRMFFLHESFINKVYEVYDEKIKDAVNKSYDNYVRYIEEMSIDGEMNNRLVKSDVREIFDKYVERNYLEECDDNLDFYRNRINYLDYIFDERKIKDFIQYN